MSRSGGRSSKAIGASKVALDASRLGPHDQHRWSVAGFGARQTGQRTRVIRETYAPSPAQRLVVGAKRFETLRSGYGLHAIKLKEFLHDFEFNDVRTLVESAADPAMPVPA